MHHKLLSLATDWSSTCMLGLAPSKTQAFWCFHNSQATKMIRLLRSCENPLQRLWWCRSTNQRSEYWILEEKFQILNKLICISSSYRVTVLQRLTTCFSFSVKHFLEIFGRYFRLILCCEYMRYSAEKVFDSPTPPKHVINAQLWLSNSTKTC